MKPFTVPHFRAWAEQLVLDSGDPWVLEDFQAAFLRDVFAGILECWLVVPEGNAKTTLGGGLILYHAQHRKFARVPVAASSRDQAEWLYQAAAGFVERSPSIEMLFRCQEGYRRIRCDAMGSRIQIFAADDRTGDGIIPSLAFLEELHRHRTLRLYRTWRGKIEKRGGQLAAISTAGEPDGEFEEVRQKMREAATSTRTRGAFTRSATKDFVLHEYAVPEGKSPDNMRDVKTANPLKAITVPMLKRKHDSPAMTPAHWRRFVCGLPAGMDEQPITAEMWDPLRADIGQIEDGEAVYLAPSIGGNAAVAVAAERHDGRVAFKVFHVDPDPKRSTQALTEELIVDLCGTFHVLDIHYPEGAFVRSKEVLEGRVDEPIHGAHPSPSRLVAASGTFDRLLYERKLIHDGDRKTRGQILAATKKSTETGERYIPGDSSRAIGAVIMAVHAASAPTDDLKMILPSVGVG